MGVRFDDAAAIAALKQRLMVAMRQLQSEFFNEAKQGMRTPEGAESLYEGDVTAAADIISAEVLGGAFAVMDNYGTGSEMDRDNPALADYMASDLWNPTRGKHGPDDTEIRSRPAGTWTDIFGETHTAKGPGGFNLERKGGKFAPQPPSHALQTAARWMANGRMQAVIHQAMDTFPWHKFIVVDER